MFRGYSMADPRTYAGCCHCGAVRFEVKTDPSSVLACNCSICSKTGWLLAFAPEEQFGLLSGQEALSDYQFGKKWAHHLFCRTCGVRSFSRGRAPDGREMCAVNVRCLDGLDVAALTIRSFDGESL